MHAGEALMPVQQPFAWGDPSRRQISEAHRYGMDMSLDAAPWEASPQPGR